MIYSTESNCRICKSSELIEVFNLGDQCIGSLFPKESEANPPKAPLVLIMCEKCGLVQLKHTVNASLLYTGNYGYRSGLNNTMREHLQGIANYASSLIELDPNDVILDIGCNDGTLLSSYTKGKKVGIDPCGKQFQQYHPNDLVLIPDYFSQSKYPTNFEKAKIVTSISMFYDLPDPVKFAQDVESVLDDNGVWIMEQSYLPVMLKMNSFDTVCHEHLEYYGLAQIDYIAKAANLRIFDVSFNDVNGGSFRVSLCKRSAAFKQMPIVVEVLQQELSMDTFADFTIRCENLKKELMDFIHTQREKGKTFAIYGASTKGNTLLQYYGIDKKIIDYGIAERNPLKYGCRTPGTDIPIFSETEVRSKKPDYMIVLPWHFKTEFIKREANYLKNGGSLLFPLPTVTLSTGEFCNTPKH